ncbi:O-antigen ligase family protein [Streptomyces sp. NPDC090106]|uniref:O-antigen ligase family protein n=1 Tax=Streptomyces sp. NPDC090106 TaxID=3365946 RepID=UPI0038267D69
MTSAAGPAQDGDGRRNVSDAVGVAVLGACAAWSLVTAAVHDGRPEGVLLAVLAVAAGYAAGRICGALLPVAALGAAALTGLALVVAVPHLSSGPEIITPLGHAGATAAVLTLATGAACCAAWAARSPSPRVVLGALAAGIVATAAVVGSTTGFVTCAGVLLCSLAAGRMRRRRGAGLAGLVLAATAVTAGTWAVAADTLPEGLTASLAGQLTPHRVELWQDALALARQDAALGVGPGRFGEASATAARTLLSDGKPHSAPLQQAAEQGIVGLVLLAAAFGWLLYTLWRSPRPTPVVLTAGAALTALAAIAAVGNALSFTTVSVGAGLLAGLATARPLADTA